MNTRSGLVLSFAAKAALRGRGGMSSGTTAKSSPASTVQRMPSAEPYRFWGLAIIGLSALSLGILGAVIWGLMQAASVVFG